MLAVSRPSVSDGIPLGSHEFTAFYLRYCTLVYAVAAKRLHCRSDAEDVMQRVFLKIWSEPHCFRGGNIESWLTAVTKNICIDELRRMNRERHSLECALDSEYADVEDEALSRMFFVNVSEALHEVRADRRAAMLAAILFDQTHAAIAARYNLPLGTVKTRVRSGIAHVRRKLRVEHTSAPDSSP